MTIDRTTAATARGVEWGGKVRPRRIPTPSSGVSGEAAPRSTTLRHLRSVGLEAIDARGHVLVETPEHEIIEFAAAPSRNSTRSFTTSGPGPRERVSGRAERCRRVAP